MAFDANLKKIQQSLMAKGYDLGPTKDDGIWGQYTAKAVSDALAGTAPSTSNKSASVSPAASGTAAKSAGTKGWEDSNDRVFVSYKTDPSFIPDPDKTELQNQIRWEGQQKARGGYGVSSTYRNYDSSMTPQMNARYEYAKKMARQGYNDTEPNGAPDASPEEKAQADTTAKAFGVQTNPNQAELNKRAFTNENAELLAMLRIAGLR